MSGALDRCARAIAADGVAVERHVSLASRCTYRVGGSASVFVEVPDAAVLSIVATHVAATGVDTLVVGKGSNLLVADGELDRCVLALGEGFSGISIDADRGRVVAGGAVALPVLARRSVAAGVTGLEWAVGVPGTVGGAVRMNAGGHGAEIVDSLVEVRVVDLRVGKDVRMAAEELDLGYRRSDLGPSQVVTEATFAVGTVSDPRAEGTDLLAEIVQWRREHQPGGANAGSVFANPEGDSAGRLIDAAGLRGYRIGTAAVSEKHANFIQADAGGSADDVVALMAHVRRVVRDQAGVDLRAETRLVGFDDATVDAAGGHR